MISCGSYCLIFFAPLFLWALWPRRPYPEVRRADQGRGAGGAATARRAKLTTRQYQIERDQTILIALDAGRLMTARIEGETKFDSAIHACLALMSMAARGGHSRSSAYRCRARAFM